MATTKTGEPKGRLGNQGYQEGNEGYDEDSHNKGPHQQARRHGNEDANRNEEEGKPPDSQ